MLQNQPRRATTSPDPNRFPASVQPLLRTMWGQREPFKFMCPFDEYVSDFSLYGTYTPDSGHYAVGCGPLAMAQYMYYYKFPKHGTGEESVTVKYDQGDVTLYVDFEQATYDWDNMINDYQGEYTREQGQAVAQLCYHCGVAAQTTWNALGGGTTDARLVDAFIKHFNYNDTAHYIPRSRYDEPTWMEMIYAMLSSGNPILYSAKDINIVEGIIAGHNFIIDGYDENGLVHVIGDGMVWKTVILISPCSMCSSTRMTTGKPCSWVCIPTAQTSPETSMMTARSRSTTSLNSLTIS